MAPFWAKYILFELKKYSEVIFHEIQEGNKLWGGMNLSFQNWHNEFDKFWSEKYYYWFLPFCLSKHSKKSWKAGTIKIKTPKKPGREKALYFKMGINITLPELFIYVLVIVHSVNEWYRSIITAK